MLDPVLAFDRKSEVAVGNQRHAQAPGDVILILPRFS